MTTVEKVQNYLLLEIDQAFQPQVEDWILAITEHIERVTQRKFTADEQFQEKKYDGTGKLTQYVGDFIEMEKVEVDGNEITALTYPANTLPKFKLYSENGFSQGKQNVVVSAKWGFSEEPPLDIVHATTVLVAGVVQANQQGGGKIIKEKLGNYDVAYSTEKEFSDYKRALDILASYRRYSI